MKKIVLLAFVLVLLSTTVVVRFVIPVEADWTLTETIYIRADGTIEGTTDISTVDNVTYTFTNNVNDSIVVERDNIVIDGAGYLVQGTGFGSGAGIEMTGRRNIGIKNMEINAFDYGIWLYESSNNSISGNNITNNVYSIWLYSSINNYISGNTITEVIGTGIVLLDSSNNNSISGNNITNNNNGIYLSHSLGNGIYRNNTIGNNGTGIWFSDSSDNLIHHNNFVDNTEQVLSVDGVYDFWDNGYPSGGNYWSDYTGADVKSGPNQDQLNSDGIGDTPYVINSINEDRYPLMNPYVLPDTQLRYYELLANYMELQSEYNNLVAGYDSLQVELNDLQSKYNSLTNELNNTRNVMYALLATTMVLIATTIYLAIRKPKVKPELKTD